ncbi:MAG: sensor histidine kinase [Bacteroidota bacterium]
MTKIAKWLRLWGIPLGLHTLVSGGICWELRPAMTPPWALGLYAYLLLLGACVVFGGTAGRARTVTRLLYWEAVLRLLGVWLFGLSPPLAAAWFALVLVGGALRDRLSQVLILGAAGLAFGIGFSFLHAMAWVPLPVHAWRLPGAGLSHGLHLLITATLAYLLAHYLRHWRADRHLLNTTREAATKLTEANVKLQDFAAQSEELAVANERNRLAREIHDTLGYSLVSISRQLEACEELVKADPERAIAILRRLGEMVRSGLQDVRQSLSTLRESFPGLRGRRRWQQLIDTFAAVTGVKVVAEIENEFNALEERMELVVYRIIQEGLTNAYRHGHAHLIMVFVWCEDGKLLVRISDNGHGVTSLAEGFGLRGIKERVAALDGQFAWRSTPGRGFDLGVELPLERGMGNAGDTGAVG